MARTILIVDDSGINRMILGTILRADYTVMEAADGAEALEVLRKSYKIISAVLLDIEMPVMGGYQVLEKMQQNPLLSQIPVIVITGNAEREFERKALLLGATDFVAKPFDTDIVKHRLDNLVHLRESSALVNALQKDRLTGLWNREVFFEKATQMIARHQAGFYVLSCTDIDDFKIINDQYGTEVGDEVIKRFARVIERECADADSICGRISADNFILLQPRHLLGDGMEDWHRLGTLDFEGMAFPVTISIGRYTVSDTSLSVNAMYDRAKIAQDTVKGRYDVHVAVFDETLRENVLKRQGIVGEMRAALASGHFEAWFQPQYNHASGALIGAEALARWRHPERGLIPPGEFVPIFEKNGFVYKLDTYIWEQVCVHLRTWMDEGRNPLPISVNVSRYDLYHDDLVDTIVSLTERYGIPPDLLRLEITESAFADSTRRVVESVKQLIACGFTVEIDDFGSGYSSLNTLKDVPAQILKLDMRFLETDTCSVDASCEVSLNRGGNILESIVRMAKWIGMSVIAEGVETLEQADFLKSIGCTYVQGYLYARPMPASDYEDLCRGVEKEERLITLEVVENLDSDSFWDPTSMDTLIFNSYVGAACIFEYHNGTIELLRATDKYAQMIGRADMSVKDVLRIDWAEQLDAEDIRLVIDAIEESLETKAEATCEYAIPDLTGCSEKMYLRSTLRVIATAGDDFLVYCTNENITESVHALQRERDAAQHVQSLNDNLQHMMDDMPGGFVRMQIMPDGSMPIVFINDGFCKLVGMSHGEIRAQYEGRPFWGIHEDDVPMLQEALARTGITEDVINLKYRLMHESGAYIWTNVSIRATQNDGEQFVNSYYSDLSAQEQKELALRDTMPIVLSAIMDSSSDLAFAKDKDFNYICCSPAFVTFTRQKTEADVVGKNDYDFWTKEEADRFRADDVRLFEGGESLIDFIEPIPSDDGVQHYSVTSKYILRDAAGEIVGLYGCGRDVTEEQRTIERLRVSEEEYRLAIEHSGKLIYRYNHASDSVDLPESVSLLFGLPRHLDDVPDGLLEEGKVTEETKEQYREFFRSIKRGDAKNEVNVCRKTTAGAWRWYAGSSFTIFDNEGKPTSTIIVFEDVTDARDEEAAASLDRSRFKAALDAIYPVLISVNLTEGFYEVIANNEHLLMLDAPRGPIGDMVSSMAEHMSLEAAEKLRAASQVEELKRMISKAGDSIRFEYEQFNPDGGKQWLELLVILVVNDFNDDIMALVACRSIDAQKAMEHKLEQAELDGMTGIYNKTTTEELAREHLALAGDATCALAIIDLDDLKGINDSLGHITGDRAIKVLAELLCAQFRADDIIGRVGGDEFVAFSCGITETRVSDIMDTFVGELSTIVLDDEHDLALSASIGIVMGESTESYEELFEKADKALYHVKRSGKAGFAFYTPEMEDESYRFETHPPARGGGVLLSSKDRSLPRNLFRKRPRR